MPHYKRRATRKHGARAQAGRFHDPDDAASGGSWKRLAEVNEDWRMDADLDYYAPLLGLEYPWDDEN